MTIFWKKYQVLGKFLTFKWQFSGGSGPYGQWSSIYFPPFSLPRDPRAVLHSQQRVWPHWFNWPSDNHNVSRLFCRELHEDLRHFRRLSTLYPDRVKVVRYEDGATDPYQYTKDLYRFLELDYTERIADHVKEMTTTHRDGYLGGSFLVYRNDPIATMNKWRKGAQFSAISAIDKNCAFLYPTLGYKKVTSQEHLNSNESLVTKSKL